MAYASDAESARGLISRLLKLKLDFAPEEGDWGNQEQPPRDFKKIFLVAGLGTLSWVATYVGMLELIEANMGQLPFIHKVIIGFSVAMLMTMIIWLLDQMFAPVGAFTRLCYIAGYIFLTIISAGFGFGFYWKMLESRSESSRSAESAVSQVQGALYAASTRLEQLQATLVQLAAVSNEKAEIERAKGTSCPNSKPGDGPRRKMREEDAQRFGFASEFVKGRVGAVKADMGALDADLAKIAGDDKTTIDPRTGTRNEFMKALGRKLDRTVTGFNAFRTDPQLRQLRTDLADRAETTTFGDLKKGGFLCPDPQLQQALRGTVRAIDQLPELEKPAIAAVEGSEATIEAFRRLTTTFYGLLAFKLPPSADELRELQQKAVQSVEGGAGARELSSEAAGLSKRDYVPLAIAIFVDLCLLLVSIGRPMNRFVATKQKMIEAEHGPVFPILSRFSEIHDQDELRRTFDIFREVIFDIGKAYYIAVPLNAPRSAPDREQLKREAQVLANLCYALEGQGILARPWRLAPLLLVNRCLRRQGSKFIECYKSEKVAPVPRLIRVLQSLFRSDAEDEKPAFRIYAFKSGAWPEMILGAVMGAARRVEADNDRRRFGAESIRSREPVFAATGGRFDFPYPDERSRVSRHEPPAAAPPLASEAATGAELLARTAATDAGRSRAADDPKFAAQFGIYKRQAQAELNVGVTADDTPARAANSNTAPSSRRSSAAEPAATSTIETVLTDPAQAGGKAAEGIDVVLSRETATFTMPAPDAGAADGLIGRLGRALAGAEVCAPEVGSETAGVPLIAPPTATTGSGEAGQALETDIEGDQETSDAVVMAGRFGPVSAG
jgi:hypothetical protein